MSIYKEGLEINPKYVFWAVAIIVAIALLGSAYMLLAEALKPNAISAQLEQNPVELAKTDFTTLKVVITNVTAEKVNETLVTVEPVATASILVDGKTRNTKQFGIIAPGETREDEFLIRVNPGRDVLAGNYKLHIDTTINGQRFDREVVLVVK